MSDKNGHSGTVQWTKGTTAAAAIAAHHHQLQQQKHFDTNATNLGPTTTATTLYGGSGSLNADSAAALHHVASSAEVQSVPYTTARFQAPSIHHALGLGIGSSAIVPPPLHTHNPIPSSTVLTSVSATSNVPAPSGFVPPVPFPPSAPAAVTSVLTPNPFAAVNSFSATTATTNSSVDSVPPFGLEQLQHLNAQHYELSKIMAATATVPQPLALPLTTTSSTSIAHGGNNITQALGGRHHVDIHGAATCSGAITNTLVESVMNAYSAGGPSVTAAGPTTNITPTHSRILGVGVKPPDEEKLQRLRLMVEGGVSELGKQKISQILEHVSTLKPVEKLLLYMRLPGEAPETDPLRQPQNPLGTRSEINHTINWVRSHLEHDPQVSIPKQDVYNDYIQYCERLDIKPLSTADFGKVMKQVFPGIRPRRLGTRGHSRYCYAAMRKTTKLNAPQLPQFASASSGNVGSAATPAAAKTILNLDNASSAFSAPSLEKHHAESDSWDVIKNWAETMLNIQVENVHDLARQIKSNATTTNIVRGTTGTVPKKYTPREPKEKRLLADSGPLKKRRKKKRKGSSSSESSCNQAPVNNTNNNTNNKNNNNNNNDNNNTQLSPSRNSGYNLATVKLRAAGIIAEDEQQQQDTVKLVEVKQEIMDSPKNMYQGAATTIHQQLQKDLPKIEQNVDNYMPLQQQQQQQQQQQLMPINLATEQRTVLARAPPSAAVTTVITTATPASVILAQHANLAQQQSAFMPTRMATAHPHISSGGYMAVKNLTPKIMELSTPAVPAATSTSAATSTLPTSAVNLEQNVQSIKEEIIDDYSTTNVVCKKVLKAHQTKGFWVNSPTAPTAATPPVTSANSITSSVGSSSSSMPALTTTASTPPPQTTNATTVVNASVDNFLMGPPLSNTSISPVPPTSTSAGSGQGNNLLDANVPKVASRNYNLLLRARRLAAAASANSSNNDGGGTPTSDLDKDSDLPENLGLPRERVISICNMDKHELDGYLIPNDDEEEENSQDQDTELLQYFPTGDAEEKILINSLDAADNRNPAIRATNSAIIVTTTTTTATIATTLIQANNLNKSISNAIATTSTSTTTPTISTTAPRTTNASLTPTPANGAFGNNVRRITPTVTRAASTNSITMSSYVNASGGAGGASGGGGVVGGDGASNQWKQQLTQQQQQQLAQQQLLQYAPQQQQQQKVATTKNELAGTKLTSAVVSASASLALMSQKHQQQQQQQQQNQQQLLILQQQQQQQQQTTTQRPLLMSGKRKLQVGSLISTPDSLSQAARKNYTFLPISPNINTTPSTMAFTATIATTTKTIATVTATDKATTINSVCFASPGATRFRPRPALLSKQQSLDCDSSSDPMIGATRRRRSYVGGAINSSTLGSGGSGIGAANTSGYTITTSASAPPSPSVYQQFMGNQWSNFGTSVINTDTASTAFLTEHDTLDLDLLDADMKTADGVGFVNTTTNYEGQNNASLALDENDFALTPLTETQRSQSVPLSQLQRNHSPHTFRAAAYGQNYSACPSMAPTPVPPEFADSSSFFSENSNSQNSSNQPAAGANNIKLAESGVLASDSTAMIDEVDVSELLSLPEFVHKMAHVGQSRTATTTTCSSAGSSSGYSSGACTTFGGSNGMMQGVGGSGIANSGSGIISRSVPSTPLPYQTYNIFGTSSQMANKRFTSTTGIKDDLNASPTFASNTNAMMSCQGGALSNYKYGATTLNMRTAYDISKSMPTTPTTTPLYNKFNYSPTELTRDFLINGNTIESYASPFGGCGSETLLNAGDSLGIVGSASVAGGDGSSNGGCTDGADDDIGLANALDADAAGEVEAIMVGSDLLDSL